MDNETKQIFEQLIEAINNNRIDSSQLVEAVNSPDWWSVIATILAAITAAVITYVLGKRQNELQQQQLKIQEHQNELQEQQIRQQEYDLYRRMYTQVHGLDFFNKTILLRMVAIMTSNEDKNLRQKFVDDIWKEYEKHSNEFSECAVDMELKQCGTGLDAKLYYDALQASKNIILMFKYFVEDELLIFNPSLAYNPQIEDHNTPPEVFIDMILSIFRGSNPQLLRNQLLVYANIVEKSKQAQLLETIKDRITPTNTK